MATSDNLGVTEPCHGFAHIVEVFTGVCDDQITRIDFAKLFRLRRRNELNRFDRPNAIVGIYLAVVEATNPWLNDVRFRHSVSPPQFAKVAYGFVLPPLRAKLGNQLINPAHDFSYPQPSFAPF